MLHRDERAQQHARPGEQHQRERHLGDDQRLAQDRLSRAAGQAAAGFAHRRSRDRAGCCAAPARGRRRCSSPPRRAARRSSTGRLSAISASSGIVPGGTSERIAGRPAYASSVPERAGGQREDEALRQQLPHQPPAARAERRADGHLALARAWLSTAAGSTRSRRRSAAAARRRRAAPRRRRAIALGNVCSNDSRPTRH